MTPSWLNLEIYLMVNFAVHWTPNPNNEDHVDLKTLLKEWSKYDYL
jgi:hypothetical protein